MDDAIASGARDQKKASKDEPQQETSGNGQTEVMDVDDDSKGLNARQITPRPSQAQTPVPTQPNGFSIDVCFEASKLPLDIAIFNSVRATGGEEKIRKYLQAVLVVGGTALTQGIVHALESRCGILFSRLLPHRLFITHVDSKPLLHPLFPTWRRCRLYLHLRRLIVVCLCGREQQSWEKWTASRSFGLRVPIG